MARYYRLKSGKQLWYAEHGWFECPKSSRDKKGIPDFNHEGKYKGDFQRKFIDKKEEPMDDGKVMRIRRILTWKASKKNPPYCKCGEKMKWKGYGVWLKKVLDEGKVIGGMFRMGAKEKRYWHRYFKTKSKQLDFIQKVLAKE